MTKKTYYFLLAFIFVLAIFLRVYKLGQIPTGLYWDEIAMFLDAKVVSQTGFDMHGRPWYQLIYPSYGDYKLPVYLWLASLSFKIFGAGEWQLRLISMLAGLGTIGIAFLIVKEFIKLNEEKNRKLIKKTQLATGLILAVSPWAVMFSRTAFEGHLGQFFFASSMFFLLKSFNKKKYYLLGISVFLAALSTYTYFSVRFVWPAVFVFTGLVLLYKTRNKIKNLISYILFPIIFYYLLLLPMFQSELYGVSNNFRMGADSVLNLKDYALEQNVYRELAGNSIFDRLFFHRHYLLIRELAKNYSDHLSLNFLFLTGDSNLRHGTGKHGLFLLCFLPALIAGLYYLSKNNFKALLILFFWWLAALLPASVPETTPHALRSLNALVPLAIIMGFGLTKFFSLNKLVKFIYLLLIIININYFAYHYFKQYPIDSNTDWQGQYKELALELAAHQDRAQIYLDKFDDKFYLWLLSFGNYSPKEIQQISKENYFINKLDNVNFEIPTSIENLEKPVVIAGRPSELKNLVENLESDPDYIKTISAPDNTQRFIILRFEK